MDTETQDITVEGLAVGRRVVAYYDEDGSMHAVYCRMVDGTAETVDLTADELMDVLDVYVNTMKRAGLEPVQ